MDNESEINKGWWRRQVLVALVGCPTMNNIITRFFKRQNSLNPNPYPNDTGQMVDVLRVLLRDDSWLNVFES